MTTDHPGNRRAGVPSAVLNLNSPLTAGSRSGSRRAAPGSVSTATRLASIALGVVSTALLLASTAMLLACGPPRVSDSQDVLTAEQGEREGCTLFVRKCSRCHEIQKISVYRASSPARWVRLVDRMRRLQGSQIKPHQGDLITECLVERQFGRAGLEELGIAPPDDPESSPDGDDGDGDDGDGQEDGDDGDGDDDRSDGDDSRSDRPDREDR